jgi:pimeloyl-ACP methyl ester carboxylesterase
VLEDRAKPQGRRIELVFARLKSTAAAPGAPIVYLDGGPGGSGIGIVRVPGYYRLFDGMRAIGDVILLSQRGTGLSSPRLTCRGNGAPIPLDLFLSADRMAEVLGPRAAACAAELRGKGIDLSAYNTIASADDLEDLRAALGVPNRPRKHTAAGGRAEADCGVPPGQRCQRATGGGPVTSEVRQSPGTPPCTPTASPW